MSLLRRIWHTLLRPTRVVGRDLEGNRFYEYPSITDDPTRTKRVVKYAKPMELWDYPSAQRRLPVQWSGWLAHTRREPPTVQELEHDLLRQARVQHNAVMIETRDREAAERVEAPGNSGLLAPRQVHALSELPGGSLLYAEDAKDVRPASVQKAAEIPKENEDPWKAAASSDEPQGWSPSVGPRGRGV